MPPVDKMRRLRIMKMKVYKSDEYAKLKDASESWVKRAMKSGELPVIFINRNQYVADEDTKLSILSNSLKSSELLENYGLSHEEVKEYLYASNNIFMKFLDQLYIPKENHTNSLKEEFCLDKQEEKNAYINTTSLDVFIKLYGLNKSFLLSEVMNGNIKGFAHKNTWYIYSNDNTAKSITMGSKVIPVFYDKLKNDYVAVDDYAKKHGLVKSLLIEGIRNGRKKGFVLNGKWYIKKRNKSPRQSVNNDSPFDDYESSAVSVDNYSKQHGIPIQTLMKEISNGYRNGFPSDGVWYIGKDPDKPHRQNINTVTKEKEDETGCLSAIGGIVVLVVIFFALKSCIYSGSDVSSKKDKKSNYSSSVSTLTVDSAEELNCIMRLAIERQKGKNSYSDDQIATLCDTLF